MASSLPATSKPGESLYIDGSPCSAAAADGAAAEEDAHAFDIAAIMNLYVIRQVGKH